jgi:Zn-dependent peptidase ImmA (M78 family)
MGENIQYGKKRLFELMERVNGVVISEQKLSTFEKEDIINDFYAFVDTKLNIGQEKPKIRLINDKSFTQKNKSFANYNPNNHNIEVYSGDRIFADVLRSLAHELVHHKQNILGQLDNKSGETGSKHENQANSLAGSIMREYSKKNSSIFE